VRHIGRSDPQGNRKTIHRQANTYKDQGYEIHESKYPTLWF
jgi:hypothetical protein